MYRLFTPRSNFLIVTKLSPRCGKTTLARLLAKRTGAIFKELSATDSGVPEVRSLVEEARGALTLTGRLVI